MRYIQCVSGSNHVAGSNCLGSEPTVIRTMGKKRRMLKANEKWMEAEGETPPKHDPGMAPTYPTVIAQIWGCSSSEKERFVLGSREVDFG